MGGIEGESVDTTVVSVPSNPWPNCGGGCVALLALSLSRQTGGTTDYDGIIALSSGEADRWIVLNMGDHILLLNAYAASPEEFRRFMPVVSSVLKTVQITP